MSANNLNLFTQLRASLRVKPRLRQATGSSSFPFVYTKVKKSKYLYLYLPFYNSQFANPHTIFIISSVYC